MSDERPPSAPIDERIAERRREVRAERRRRRRRRTVTALVLVVLLGALVAVERSPLVGLEEIQIVGNDRLSADEVREAAELELGTSTLRLRLGRVEERIEALPAVRGVTASRADPLTVRIVVEERVPVLQVEDEDGDVVLVDREGVVLASGTQDGVVPVELAATAPELGASVSDEPVLANAFRAWRDLSGPLRTEVVGMEAAGPSELSLFLRDGIEVRLGRAERLPEKVRALGAILEDVGEARISVIDVRAPSAPFVVP